MRKKKILYVITKSVWGGAQRYIFDLATNLPKNEFEPIVACGGSGLLIDKLKQNNIKTASIPYLERDVKLKNEFLSLIALWKIFRKEKPDAVHLNSTKVGGLGAITARLAGVPKIIFTAHGWPFKEDRSWPMTALIWLISWLTSLFSHHVIVITKSDFESSREFAFLPAKKFGLIPNGIDENADSPIGREEARKSLGIKLPKDGFLIGTIAEFTKNKGLKYLIESMIHLPETIHLVLIGDGEEIKEAKEFSKNLSQGHRIKFAGFRENASRYLGAFDAFALPSIKEGLPYVLLEAGRASLSVIATNVGGIPDIITHGENGLLVKPKDAYQLSRAINSIFESRGEESVLGQNIRNKIEKNHSIKKMLAQTTALYEA